MVKQVSTIQINILKYPIKQKWLKIIFNYFCCRLGMVGMFLSNEHFAKSVMKSPQVAKAVLEDLCSKHASSNPVRGYYYNGSSSRYYNNRFGGYIIIILFLDKSNWYINWN